MQIRVAALIEWSVDADVFAGDDAATPKARALSARNNVVALFKRDALFAMDQMNSCDVGPKVRLRVEPATAPNTVAPDSAAETKPPDEAAPDEGQQERLLWDTPAEYLKATGKRFRITKDQQSRGISRDDAFREFCAGRAVDVEIRELLDKSVEQPPN